MYLDTYLARTCTYLLGSFVVTNILTLFSVGPSICISKNIIETEKPRAKKQTNRQKKGRQTNSQIKLNHYSANKIDMVYSTIDNVIFLYELVYETLVIDRL